MDLGDYMSIKENKISEIYLWRIKLRYKEPFETSFGRENYKDTIIIGIKAGDFIGYGELVAGSKPMFSYETINTSLYIYKEYFIPLLLGKDADPQRFYTETSWIRGYPMAKASFEMALWDLYSKIQGKPLYKVIGGVKHKVEVGVSIGIQKRVDILISKISKYLEEGYRRIKIKIKPGYDFNVLDKVRKEFPDIPLTVDANAAYTKNDIKKLMKLDEYNLMFIEQPLYYWDLYYHSVLQSNIKTPICLDESITNGLRVEEAIHIGAARVINVKPGRVGGIKETLYINKVGLKYGVPMWIGGMLETGIGRGFNVSIATLENVKYPSDISESKRYFDKDIITKPWYMDNGYMKPRDEDGIGVDIDWEFFYKNMLKEWTFK